MNQVYSLFTKRIGLCVAAGLLSTGAIAQAQTCGANLENFNTPGSGMAGFTSSTKNSAAAGFAFAQTGADGFLQRCAIPSAGTAYEITTPTYTSFANQSTIGFGFELAGSIEASRITVSVQYIANNDSINTVELATFSQPVYTGSGNNQATVICSSSNINTINGFTPGEAYRLIIEVVAETASNNNQCIVFDDFRTTGANSQAPLPVTFTNFSAKKAGTGVQVFWNVAGEKDVVRYEVERSTNGRDFAKIGEVAATGNAGYSFADAQAANGVAFYRVRNIDQDGKFKYTAVARVNLSQLIALKAYPQPALNQITVEHGETVGKGTLSVNTTDGRRVLVIDLRPDVNQTEINISSLKPGLYIVRFDNGSGQVETTKVLKQ